MQRILANIIGFIFKIGLLPASIYLLWSNGSTSTMNPSTYFLSMIVGGSGLIAVLYTEVILLRFGDGRSHFALKPTRLVDVGMYARTRHPYHWYLSIYYLGVFIYFFGMGIMTWIFGLLYLMGGLLYLTVFQEGWLSKSFKASYASYQKQTPAWYWKINISENQKLMIIPQLIWVLGRIVLQLWYRIRVKGLENIPHSKSFLIVANHESYLDPFLFGIFIPFEIQFVTTADVFTSQFKKILLRWTGTFPMHRHRQDLKSIRTMIRMIREGRTVCIFPEGGRSLDGSPLHIVDETIKLIHKCKVPILPVQISGAYEIWPRWASNLRRAQFSADFQPVIPVNEQTDLKTLRNKIQEAIFRDNRDFTPTKSRFIAKGLEHYIWACQACLSHQTIELTGKDTIACSNCGSTWTLDNRYVLHTPSGESTTLIEWNKKIDSIIKDNPLQEPVGCDLFQDETPYLAGSIKAYQSDAGESLQNDLQLILTDTRFILIRSEKIFKSWLLKDVTVLTLDFTHAVSIGHRGVRYIFVLHESDNRYKWRAYFQVLTGNLAN